MCEAVGHPVTALERVAFGPLRLEGLAPGRVAPAHRRRGRAAARGGRRLALPAVRLRALRGATTVPENTAEAIVEATEELVREVMERNELSPDDMVSCLFTCTDDLDAEFPALAARNLGLSAVPLLCAREIDVPGRAAAHHPADAALLRRRVRAGAPRLPARRRSRCAATSTGRSDGHRVQPPPGVDPGLPGGRHLRVRRRPGEAGLERDPVGADPGGDREGAGAARPRSTATPTRTSRRCAARSRTAATSPRRAWPWATAPARSCWPPPRRCSSPAPSWSTPGRRSRCTRTWPRSRAPARSPCRWMPRAATTSTRWPARSPPPRGSCWCATPTTRPRPRCRWTRSTRSWRACRATWR